MSPDVADLPLFAFGGQTFNADKPLEEFPLKEPWPFDLPWEEDNDAA